MWPAIKKTVFIVPLVALLYQLYDAGISKAEQRGASSQKNIELQGVQQRYELALDAKKELEDALLQERANHANTRKWYEQSETYRKEEQAQLAHLRADQEGANSRMFIHRQILNLETQLRGAYDSTRRAELLEELKRYQESLSGCSRY